MYILFVRSVANSLANSDKKTTKKQFNIPPLQGKMHPVLRQMRPPTSHIQIADMDSAHQLQEGEGIARVGANPDTHPRVHLKKDSSEAYVPSRNVFRDEADDSRLTMAGEEGEGMRHLKYTAGKVMQGSINSKRQLEPDDFELDTDTGVSAAKAHLAAADLVTAYEQTVREEANFQKKFNNNVRTLISRQETTYGLMHLWDFINAFIANPSSKSLTAQLFLIVQHSRDDGILREALLSIADPTSQWLVDLVNILQSIVVQERSLSIASKVAAINYSVISLSRHYARKVFKTPFVPLDKEAKISTFYMRCVIKLLVLSDDLGMYRNERIQRVVSASRHKEMSDQELMFNLKTALAYGDDEGEGSDYYDEDEEDDESGAEVVGTFEGPYASSPLVSSQHHAQGVAQSRCISGTSDPVVERRKLVRFA